MDTEEKKDEELITEEKNTEEKALEKPKKIPRFVLFLMKHKKLLIIITAAIVALLLVLQGIYLIHSAILTKKVQTALDGKVFMEEHEGWSWARVYSFQGNKMGEEFWDFDNKEISGDLNELQKYRAKGILFDSEIEIKVKDGNSWYTAGYFEFRDGELIKEDMKLTTAEEINKRRKYDLCAHEFLRGTVLQKATCSKEGKQEKTCRKCGYSEIADIEKLDHTYKNDVCTKCFEKKPAEKYYGIDADSWYTYDDFLAFQNCKLQRAEIITSTGAIVLYYPVCRSCRAVGEMVQASGVEINRPITKYFSCKHCGANTTVRLELVV